MTSQMDADCHNWRQVKNRKRKRIPSSTNKVDQKVQALYEKTYTFQREEDWYLSPELIFSQNNSLSKVLKSSEQFSIKGTLPKF